jgi:hypothetical protein
MGSYVPPNSPDLVQTYLAGYSVLGGAAGGVLYAFQSGGQMGNYVRHALVGGAAGYALKYINSNILGTPGQTQGPIPHKYIPMTVAGGVSGYAVSWLVGARI